MIKTGNISLVIKAVAVCGLILSAACSETAKRGITNREVDRFVAAVVLAGCHIDKSNAPVVEDATGFTDDKLAAIVDYLGDTGMIDQDGAGFELKNEGCQ